MRLKIWCFVLVAVFLLVGCGTRKYVEVQSLETRLPYEEAISLPGNVVKNGIALAAHALNKKECIDYFSYDLNADGYLPVKIVLTNNSALRLLVHGADAALTDGKQTFSHVPSSEIIAELQDHISVPFFNVSKEEYYNEGAIRKNAIFVNYNQKGLGYRILEPGQSVSGIVCFKREKLPQGDFSVSLNVQDLGRVRYLTLKAGVL